MEKKYPDKFFYAGWMGPERYALLAGCDYTLLPSRCICDKRTLRKKKKLEELTDVEISQRSTHHGVVELVSIKKIASLGIQM